MSFEKELTSLINKYSKENESDTPDFILARYLIKCLDAFGTAVNRRDKWYSFEPWSNKEISVTKVEDYVVTLKIGS